MDKNKTATKEYDSFGHSLARKSNVDGSKPIIAPFLKLFDTTINGLDLRETARKEKPIMIADIAHYLCVAHGHHPGLIEHAMSKIVEDCSRQWLVKAADGFVRERIYLTELTVAAGPITRISKQDETDMLIVNQTKQYQMLATSDRKGCPIGAAAAFIFDWYHIRELMDIIALQLNVSIPEILLPSPKETETLLSDYAKNDNIIRAINFGADQIFAQQRAFWNILTARSISRSA